MDNNFGINLLVIPVGLLAVWALYIILENHWKKKINKFKDEIEAIGKSSEE